MDKTRKNRLREINAGAIHSPEINALISEALDHIDALERQVEAAFREGYGAGYSAGRGGVADSIIETDKTECWNLSSSKAAIASAQEGL